MLPTRRHVAYILLSLLLGVVVAEGALDLLAFAVPRVHNRLCPAWTRSFVADAELGYRAAPGAAEHDRWGFRNASLPARCDILAIGGSFTYGRTVQPVETWPRQLATVTGQPTYAMSCGGYGPCEIAALLERGLALNPRTVVIELHPASALATAYASVHGGTRFPRWRCARRRNAGRARRGRPGQTARRVGTRPLVERPGHPRVESAGHRRPGVPRRRVRPHPVRPVEGGPAPAHGWPSILRSTASDPRSPASWPRSAPSPGLRAPPGDPIRKRRRRANPARALQVRTTSGSRSTAPTRGSVRGSGS